MKKILLTSVSVLMLSAVAVGAAEAKSNHKVFFGVNVGMHAVSYDGGFKDMFAHIGSVYNNLFGGGSGAILPADKDVRVAFPDTDTVFGMEGGMRFGNYKGVWNGGFTIAAEKTMGKKADVQAPDWFWDGTGGVPKVFPVIAKNLKTNVNTVSATFDNYIRLNKSLENRLDLVVGVGLASVETNMKLADVGVSLMSHAAVLKAGFELELTENISMTVVGRMYRPIADQYYSSTYNATAGFKFLF